MRVNSLVVTRLLVSISCVCSGLTLFAQSTQARIHAVETGLGPAVRVAGQPAYHHELLAEMDRLHVPAVSVAVIHEGRIEWAKGYGTRNTHGTAVTADTLFQAASLSKGVTAMAALKLVEQGKLSLDAPVDTELKSWALPTTRFTAQVPVTLRELLSHTGGIGVHGFGGYAAGQPVPSLVQVLRGEQPANSPAITVMEIPGTRFMYSGGGYTIAQQMMLDQTGMTFPVLMKALVLGPVGMTHSSFQQPLDQASSANVALPVDSKGTPIAGGPHTYPEMAAAGLWTTPTDLAKWLMELQRSLTGNANHVLSTAMTRTMLTEVKHGYGLGVGTKGSSGKPVISHWGGNEGYRCTYFAYQDGDGIVIMTNSDNGEALALELLGSLARVYRWPDFFEK